MRRATAKRSERSPTTEPGFQCRLGLPSAWSQPETRRTTLVRSHSHTSATSPIPLLSRERVPSSPRLPRDRPISLAPRGRIPLRPFSLVSTVRASLREIFLMPNNRQMRAGALCRLKSSATSKFDSRIFSSFERDFFARSNYSLILR